MYPEYSQMFLFGNENAVQQFNKDYKENVINKMLENTQVMIDHIDNFEWSDVMKVRQSNYTAIRLINTLLINQYDKIFVHKNK